MTTTPSPRLIPSYNVSVGHRADPYRNEGRVRLHVDVMPLQQMIGESMVPRGEHLVDVPESLVDEVMGMVVDSALLKQAQERCQTQLAADASDPTQTRGRPKLRLVPGAYREINLHEMPPLRFCKIVESDLPPPMTDEERRAAAVAANVTRAQSDSTTSRRGRRRKSGDSETE